MFSTMNLPYVKGMDYGVGINTLKVEPAGVGIDPGTPTNAPGAAGQVARYTIDRINTFDQLYESLDISVDVSGQYGAFSGNGKFGFSNSIKINRQATFLLAKCVVSNPFEQCLHPQLAAPARAILENGAERRFERTYGDAFVRGMQKGGEFYAVISITSTVQEEQTRIAASLEASYNALLASADIDAKVASMKSEMRGETRISIYTYQSGGSGEQVGLTEDLAAVMKRLVAFPEFVKQAPVIFNVQVASYNTLALPKPPNYIDLEQRKQVLADFTRLAMRYRTSSNELEFVQTQPELFIDPPSQAELNAWSQFIAERLNALTRQASSCVDDLTQCQSFAFKMPEGFRLPERKLNSGRQAIIFDGRNFGGRSQALGVGIYDVARNQILLGDNNISSIKVPEGMTVRLYTYPHQQGSYVDLTTDTPDMGTFDNMASSLAIFPSNQPPPVVEKAVLFDSPGFVGKTQVVAIGRYPSLELGSGKLSSVCIPDTLRIRLFSSRDFKGACRDLAADTRSLGEWNDRTVSAIVYRPGDEVPGDLNVPLPPLREAWRYGVEIIPGAVG